MVTEISFQYIQTIYNKLSGVTIMKITRRQLLKLVNESFAATAQEEAEKINSQTGAGLVSDQAFWEKMGIKTGEELARSVLSQTYSDYYKEVNGYRPRRWPEGRTLDQMSVDEIQKLIDDLDEQGTDEWYEERHQMDQELGWEDDMMAAVASQPDKIADEFKEYENMPQQTGMGRRTESAATTSLLLRKVINEIDSDSVDAIISDIAPNVKDLSRAELELLDMKIEDLIAQLSEGKTMKITKRQLRRIIREAVQSPDAELTDPDVSEAQISAAWPDHVYHNGKKVFDTFYSNNAVDAHNMLKNEGYEDAQEGYLGYDPESDDFVMGFDAFLESYDEYGNADNDGSMEAVLVLLDPRGRPLEVMTAIPGGMYPQGYQAIKASMPQIIDVRLD
jgi:hypothetical protein